MPKSEYLSPGVYGIEVKPASAPQTLAASIGAFVGWTEKGPADLPKRVRSPEEFARIFGDLSSAGKVPICIRAFFGNGGTDAVIVRVAPSDAVLASATVDSPVKWTFTALGGGTWGNTIQVQIRGNENFITRSTAATGIKTGAYTRWDVLILYPYEFDTSIKVAQEIYEAVQFSDANASAYFPNIFGDDRDKSEFITVTTGAGGTPTALVGTDRAAIAVGTGNGVLTAFTATFANTPILPSTLRVHTDKAAVTTEAVTTGNGTILVDYTDTLDDPAIKPGTFVWTYQSGGSPRTITDAGAGVLAGQGSGTINYDTGAYTLTTSLAVTNATPVTVAYTPYQFVEDNGLGLLTGDIDSAGTNTIDYATGALSVKFAAPPVNLATITAEFRQEPKTVTFSLASGTNGSAVSRNDVSVSTLATTFKGIYALDKFEEPCNLVVPDFEGSQTVQSDLITFGKNRDDRFILLGAADNTTRQEVIKYVLTTQAGTFDDPGSKVAAFYYPNVRYVRTDTDVVETVPVTAFVAACYGRTAQNKNVGKAPAGIEDGAINAPNVVGPERALYLADRDALYQARINPVYRSDATGYAVWGVRTLSVDASWRYVNARLLHNFLFFRIGRLLTTMVFENNGSGLWARVEQTVRGYMESLFLLGYFAGATADAAYSVRCDGTNNNIATVRDGKVMVDVGFSPGTPGEFIVFRLQQPVTTATTA